MAGGVQFRTAARRRLLGVPLSNVLWVVWGVSTQAWALVSLQIGLAAMNIRGLKKNDADASGS